MLESLESFTLETMVERRNLKDTVPDYNI
jgi:hypothetical protein